MPDPADGVHAKCKKRSFHLHNSVFKEIYKTMLVHLCATYHGVMLPSKGIN